MKFFKAVSRMQLRNKSTKRLGFKSLQQQDYDYFASVLGKNEMIRDEENLRAFNKDWMGVFVGHSPLVLKPSEVMKVSKILKYCNHQNIAIVPQGGNTGLVGGSVPVHDEVILSLSNLSKIRSFDPISGILSADAGCILQVLDEWLQERNFMMPLDLGAKGTCQIGGNLSTNAGGLRLLRYGSLHGTVLSLEVVLPNGQIVELGKPLRKDNTGYDMKQLFIGSEGTLGVITGVSILTPPKPNCINVVLLGLDSYEQILKCFQMAKQDLGEILSAFEFFDRPSLDLALKHIENIRDPFEKKVLFYVLLETQGGNKEHDDSKLDLFIEKVLGEGVVCDGVLAQDNSQAASFWAIREGLPEGCAKEGGVYKYDLSVPVSQLYSVVLDMRKKLGNDGLYDPYSGPINHIIGYGHMGDGNLHLNIMTSGRSQEITQAIEPYVYELTKSYQGSISAEHGLGVMKAPHVHYSKSSQEIELMKQVKKLFDPNGILNPYKYIK